jgi:hypothetical protein
MQGFSVSSFIMDELQEAVQTVTKMSPPMLIIIVTAILNFLLKPFLPEKYLAPVGTVAGAAVAPWMFSHGVLAYDVPSPGTALVLVGAIMGFIGSVAHRRLDRWLRNKVMGSNGDNDTKRLTRSDVSPPNPQ